MKAILIKPTDKRMYSKIIEYIKSIKVPVKIISDKEEEEELLIDRIEKSMKSGAADKKEMRDFFRKYGIDILS